ncbi:MAG: VWA domain-containing protein, partial [Lentisphaerae bacterium]|nr:VWA domain-containing protein [Lentisphaerota bacterium]
MWFVLVILGICGVVLIFLAQLRLWRAAAVLTKRRPSWLLFLPAVFLSAAILSGLSAFFRLRAEAVSESEEMPQLYVLLDCSVSMTAEAGQGGSRLEAAKKVLRQLPSAFAGWELALVTFAGNPMLDFPPSTDHRSWLDAVEAVAPERPPFSGSAPGRGLELVAETAAHCPSGKAVVLLFSDGEVHVEEFEQEEAAWRKRDLPCLFVLTGTLGEQRVVPVPWVASGEAISTPDDRQMRRLLGLSASSFQVVTEQSEAGEIDVLSEKIQGLIRKHSVQRAVTETGGKNMTPFLLLLTAVFALLSIFSSRY